MNSKRLYILMCGLLFLLIIVLVGGAYETNVLLGKQSDNLVAAKAQLSSLNQQQLELAQAKKDISTYNDLYQISRTIVPETKDQTQAVRQIIKLAKASGVTIGSISFPASTLGATSAGAATSTSPTAGASAASSTSANFSQLQKVPSIPGVYTLQLIVQSAAGTGNQASYSQLISFLSSLEQNRLTALVSSISLTPVTGAQSSNTLQTTFTFNLTLNIYIKP